MQRYHSNDTTNPKKVDSAPQEADPVTTMTTSEQLEPLGAPRKRILDALNHRQPERTPFTWGFCATAEMSVVLNQFYADQGIHWPTQRDAVCDRIYIAPDYTGPVAAGEDINTAIWGIRVKSTDYGAGSYAEFTDFPLAGIESPDQLESYPWPNPDSYDYPTVRTCIEDGNPHHHWANLFWAGNPFEIYCWLTGIEEALMNVLINPELVVAALGKITEFFEGRLRRTLAVAGDAVDMVFIADDLGSQNGLLMSRDAYRNVLQPSHRRLTTAVKELAPHAKALFHSDGAVFDILPDLIDAGVDCLEAVQTDAAGMEPDRLKSTYGDRLAFHGAISVQKLLPYAGAAEVEDECRRIVSILGNGGGYIAAPSHAIQVGTPPENVTAMLRGVLGEEVLARAMEFAAI
jgi:uroporphyrinogen decarboxylase